MAGAYVPPPPPLPPVVVVTIEKLKKNGAEELRGDQITDPMVVKRWLERIGQIIGTLQVPMEQRGDLAIALLQDVAYDWWKCARANVPEPVPWATFDEIFRKEYVPEHFMRKKQDEFITFTQGELTLPECQQKFDEVAEFGRDLVPTMKNRCTCFMEGLCPDLSPGLVFAPKHDINAMYKQALELNAALLKKDEYEQAQTTLPRPPPPPRPSLSSKRLLSVPSSSHTSKKAKSTPTSSPAPTQESGKSQSQGGYRYSICTLYGRRDCLTNLGEAFLTAPVAAAPTAQPAPSQKSVAASSQPKRLAQSAQSREASARTYAMHGRIEQPAHDMIMNYHSAYAERLALFLLYAGRRDDHGARPG
ncbi:unnamed protein product [Cuscuta campestris]|uniref:Retrotransposon gag domain-containing protein n=1 Tax=Cuscuta campestris TaxID=132261 RepID=A0A484KJ61_9ASTE|nr:unnamed protein product [Cuscuta campestris]